MMSPEDVALTRGSHGTQDTGRCLMEHVSVLTGARFGPWPPCTHPVLAVLATQVNDGVSDSARAGLVTRADALSRARGGDPTLTWRLVEHAARAEQAHRPGDRAAARRRRRAERARRRWDRLLPPSRRRWLPRWVTVSVAIASLGDLLAAVGALRAAAGPVGGPERDRALIALLDTAIVTTRATGSAPDAPGPIVHAHVEEVRT